MPDCGVKWLAPRQPESDQGISEEVETGNAAKVESTVQVCILPLGHEGSHRSSADVLKPQ